MDSISMKSTTQESCLEGLRRKRQAGEKRGERRRGGQPLSQRGACRGWRRCLSCCQGY